MFLLLLCLTKMEVQRDRRAGVLYSFLSDPATLVSLSVVTVGTMYYLYRSRNRGRQSLTAADNQSYELPDGVKGSLLVKDGEMMRYLHDDAKTLHEVFQRGKKLSGDGPCLGTRESANGPYQWISYSQVEERSVSFGGGLCSIGVPPGQGSFIGVYGPNCTEWVVSEQSCNAYSRVIVSLYDTLGREAVIHIINQAEISCVVCNGSKVRNLLALKESCPGLKIVIVFEDSINDEDTQTANEMDIKLYTMKEIEEMGRKNPVDIKPASPSDLATICYTSGTTGLPKGAMLTNENIVSNAAAIQAHLEGKINSSDSHISYMPLAHMMERVNLVSLFMVGARTGFFRGDIKTLVNDIQELKPTLFVSVPRLLNRLYDKTLAVVGTSKVKKWLFETGFSSKLAEVKRGVVRNNSWWDLLVFRKIQQMLGGRVHFIISGSAPLEASVIDFLRVAFGCQVIEGYGQTEVSAAATLTHPLDTSTGHVGGVVPCIQVRLRDVPDMNYYAKDNEGEICFKGPCVTQGYYKNPEKTAELFDEDGWARSGDVGRWLPNGTLKIIDRVKNIFKLSQGEYVAPEKVENICTRSSFIAQVFLCGNSLKSCCVAIVVPDEEVLMSWAKSYGRKGVSFDALCKDESVMQVVFDDMKSTAKAGGLNSLETPRAIYLSSQMFSVENGLLTPTFKLKRSEAMAHFKKEIDEMYSKLS